MRWPDSGELQRERAAQQYPTKGTANLLLLVDASDALVKKRAKGGITGVAGSVAGPGRAISPLSPGESGKVKVMEEPREFKIQTRHSN